MKIVWYSRQPIVQLDVRDVVVKGANGSVAHRSLILSEITMPFPRLVGNVILKVP